MFCIYLETLKRTAVAYNSNLVPKYKHATGEAISGNSNL